MKGIGSRRTAWCATRGTGRRRAGPATRCRMRSPARCWRASTATTPCSATTRSRPRRRFEAGDWHGSAAGARADHLLRPAGARRRCSRCAGSSARATCATRCGRTVKRRYVALLAEHKQPELAETFFNTVSTKILRPPLLPQRLHLRAPGVATDYLDSSPPSFRSYYPADGGWEKRVSPDHHRPRPRLRLPGRRPRPRLRRSPPARRHLSAEFAPASDCQINVLRSLFFRNKAAYLIGRLINDGEVEPFADPDPARRARPAVPRHGAVRHRAHRGPVQLLARLLHGRHGNAVGLRPVPAVPDADQAAVRALHHARACTSRARRCSTATCCST